MQDDPSENFQDNNRNASESVKDDSNENLFQDNGNVSFASVASANADDSRTSGASLSDNSQNDSAEMNRSVVGQMSENEEIANHSSSSENATEGELIFYLQFICNLIVELENMVTSVFVCPVNKTFISGLVHRRALHRSCKG